MFCPTQNTGNFRKTGCQGGPTGPAGPAGPTGPAGDNNIILVRNVMVDHTDLAGGVPKVIFAAESPTATYSVLNAYLIPAGGSQWGLSGNRQVLITYNFATDIGIIPYQTLQDSNSTSTSCGFIPFSNDGYGIFLPRTDPLQVTAPGQDIIVKYFQGTTDYTSGRGFISLVLYRVTP